MAQDGNAVVLIYTGDGRRHFPFLGERALTKEDIKASGMTQRELLASGLYAKVEKVEESQDAESEEEAQGE